MIDRIKRCTDVHLNNNSYMSIEVQGNTLLAKVIRHHQSEGYSTGGFDSGSQIGDIRITFERVPCGPTTIIAQQIQTEDSNR